MLRLDWLVRSHRRVSVGASRGSDLGRDKLGFRALGSLVSSHKNRSSRVLRDGRGTLYFSLRGYKTLGNISLFHSFFRATT